ncbi:protein phosphatase 1 regulatory subunit 12A-like [Contarinia nasturtii]|uniref:protein phosphatase 1 regulatory subunit 12A-like n=1 Tax=Contarinia nasturtii TaxID=265458 RepID=UPI0012D39671|nr:protein phosphatase 1 regulatory subunit 12A-like [Contarinia nasturtii]
MNFLVIFVIIVNASAGGCATYSHLDALSSMIQLLKGQLKMAEMVTEMGCINAKYPHGGGGKVLHGCTAIGNPKCVEYLLKNGADYQFIDDRKYKALDYAKMFASLQKDDYDRVFKIDYKSVAEILEKVESSNSTDYVVAKGCYLNNTEWEEIMREAFKGYFKEAIEGGINRLVIHPIHKGGGTFLHNCASANFYTCAKVLLENGIDVDIQDDDGKKALDIARRKGYTEIADLIVRKNNIETSTDTEQSTEFISEYRVDSEQNIL